MSKYEIYTDGSASTHGVKAGGYAAVILRNGTFFHMPFGGEAMTTIGLMEMRAIIVSLEYIQKQSDAKQAKVSVYCDRQDVVLSATGVYGRKSNRDEWKRFDKAAKGLDLSISHIPRNSNPNSAKCDELAGEIRLKVEKNPTRKFNSELPK